MRPQLSNGLTAHGPSVQSRHVTRQSQNRKQNDEPELPRFSFKDLGASPTVKAVVYTALGIYGTAETYFYGRWAYEKFYRKKDAEEDIVSQDAVPGEPSNAPRPEAWFVANSIR